MNFMVFVMNLIFFHEFHELHFHDFFMNFMVFVMNLMFFHEFHELHFHDLFHEFHRFCHEFHVARGTCSVLTMVWGITVIPGELPQKRIEW